MAMKVESYKSNSGRLFLTEEAAVRHDAMELLIEAVPELALIRPRIEANLNAIAEATAQVHSLRLKNHPEVPAETTLKPPVAVDHGELAGTCDCSAGIGGASDHHPTCPSFRPTQIERSTKPRLNVCKG